MPRATLISVQGGFLFVITVQHQSVVDFSGSCLLLIVSQFMRFLDKSYLSCASFMTSQSRSVYTTQSQYVCTGTNMYYVFNGFHDSFSWTCTSYVSSPLPGSSNNNPLPQLPNKYTLNVRYSRKQWWCFSCALLCSPTWKQQKSQGVVFRRENSGHG
jgi:hypothetical protein